VEGAVIILAEALVLVSVLRQDLVGEMEEKEPEGLSWDKIEAGWLNKVSFGLLGTGLVSTRMRAETWFHLLEPMDDCGVKFMFVSKMLFKIGLDEECLLTEGATVVSGKSTEELMVSEVTGQVSGEPTMWTAEGW
jgi:hypothetical protein